MEGELITKTKPKIDIHKLMDDAMEKKNRSVYILINGENTSISVTPLLESDPRWIYTTPDAPNGSVAFECSECGARASNQTPYCPWCGEKLKFE